MEMLRNDIKNICSELAKGKSLKFELFTCYNLIHEYCVRNKVQPRQNTYKVDNGRLFINDIYVGIVEIIPKVNFDEHIYNVEEKILARQENI